MAAVLGSFLTAGILEWRSDEKSNVKLEYVQGTPAAQVSYKNSSGEIVPLDFTGISAAVVPAVVNIKSTYSHRTSQEPEGYEQLRRFFDIPELDQRQMRQPSQATGSGVIISKEGYIVTNNHVVKDADVVDVTLNDNRTYKAEVIGIDEDTDIALIKINEKDLPYLPFVNSDDAKVGEWVLAVGNPFNLNSTVTAGIISAKKRSIHIIDSEESDDEGKQTNRSIESFIQTDAAINPGNSGGALVNMSGGLVGINTAIASSTGAYAGYGFAVPSNIVSKIVDDLLKFGTVQRGWLGVQIGSVTGELIKEEDLSVNRGAYVSGFADASAAKNAGIEKGDVIVKIDNAVIGSSEALIEYIGTHHPGDKVMVTVNRQGKEQSFPVTLVSRENDTHVADRSVTSAAIGAQFEDLDTKALKRLDITGGVRVKSIGNGKLSRTEVREGFIITSVNDKPVKSVTEFNEAYSKIKDGDVVQLSGIYENIQRELIYAFRK